MLLMFRTGLSRSLVIQGFQANGRRV